MVKKMNLFDYLNILIMVFVGVVTLYPVLNTVSISFSESYFIVQNKVTFYPKGFNLDAYKFIIEDERIWRSILNSIYYTIVGVSFNLFFTAISAYPLSKKDFFGRKYFMIFIIITMFFNGGMIPNYIIVKAFGMINKIWALVIPNAIWAFQLFILKSFYQSVPDSLSESALIDGASEYIILFKIIIPMSKAALASLTLFYFMGHWNSFFLPLIYLNDPKKFPLQLLLRSMIIVNDAKIASITAQANITPMAMKNAVIFVSMIPVLALYPFLQRYFVKGMYIGSIKG